MNRTTLSRALLLAGALAASSAAHAFSLGDEEASNTASAPTQTWFFPDGSSHTVMADAAPAAAPASPDTTVLGAGPARIDDESSNDAVTQSTQTWFFPDGSSHTVRSTDLP